MYNSVMEELSGIGNVQLQEVIKGRAAKNPAVAKAIENGMVRDANVYHTAKVSGGSGIQQLLKSNNRDSVGVSTFTDNTLTSGQHLACSTIRVSWGAVASTENNAAAVVYGNHLNAADDAATAIPAALLNADVVITKNDTAIITMPLSRFIAPAETITSADSRPGTVALKQVKQFEPNVKVGIELRLPDGLAVPTDKNYFVRVELGGLETVAVTK